MRLSSAHTDEPGSMAGYLADREGLKGAGRATFLSLLHNAFGFKLQHPRWVVSALGAWVAGVTLSGILLERSWSPSVASVLPWLGIDILGAILVIALVRAQRQPSRSNREIEWRAYCLLIRPVILAERPGLLDRNLWADHSADEREAISPAPDVTEMFRGARPINLWLPAATGWGVGAVPLILWRFLLGPERWIFVLPLLGSVLVPLAWGLFRLSTYARVERAVRKKG